MRFCLASLVAVASSLLSLAQSSPPPWPNINLSSCPKLAQPLDASQRKWKYGQPESDSYVSALQLLQLKNYRMAAEGFARFATTYSDSDYRDIALINEMAVFGYLKDSYGQVRVAEELIGFPLAEPSSREIGFVTLTANLSPSVLPDDTNKERKLSDLEMWVRCGNEAVTARVRTPNMPEDLFEKTRQTSQSVLDRTAGFIALMRQQYDMASSSLEAARELNSQDALTYLLLFEAKTLSPHPDLDSGIFFLARWAELAPQVSQGSNFLKKMYVIIHGSENGLEELRALAKSNIVPPPGFAIPYQPKQKHHYGSAIAAAAIVGLLAYEAVEHSAVAQGIVSGFTGSVASSKVMIFGGPGHKSYLGCLSCSGIEADSVFNEVGQYGNSVSAISIWNSVSEFGSSVSRFSACNTTASDPPVIVDEDGKAYGRLTLNQSMVQSGAGEKFNTWLASAVCHVR
jgi:hypothetical protein